MLSGCEVSPWIYCKIYEIGREELFKRYLEGLKPQIKHMIGVQVMRNLHEAKNMALKVEFMMQDWDRYEPVRRNFSGENSKVPGDSEVTVLEVQPHSDRFREEKAAGKKKVVENNGTPKTTNPYTRP